LYRPGRVSRRFVGKLGGRHCDHRGLEQPIPPTRNRSAPAPGPRRCPAG